jgi:hypothetical protein
MPYCPSCNAEYRAGFTECADCRVPLTATMTETQVPATGDWVPVYTGKGLELAAIEENLKRRGFAVVRGPVEQSGVSIPVGVLGTNAAALYTLAVPASQAETRGGELERAIAEVSGAAPGDPEAMAEAEQDYDVRGCPACGRFFHDNYAACPGDREPLVPAVEVFEEGQLEPERVIVGDGPEPQAQELAERLRAAGFDARAGTPGGWPTALVDLPWSELTARTEAAEAALRKDEG